MSQIATTIEQSKELIKAGLDPKSADMWWTIFQPLKYEGWKLINNGEPHIMLNLYKNEGIALASIENIPAWSLSRLIDILGDFNYGPMINGSENVMSCIVNAICFDLEYQSGRVNEQYTVNKDDGNTYER